ncbi:unknown [Enterocloster bolteae CAG:59]|nr:unknown [Enterocloster bolteae CAG:59]
MADRKLIHQLLDKVLDVQEQTGHYASVDFSNYGHDISVWVKLGGWRKGTNFDFNKGFDMDEVGSERFRKTLEYLDGLLPKKMDPSGGNRGEVQ